MTKKYIYYINIDGLENPQEYMKALMIQAKDFLETSLLMAVPVRGTQSTSIEVLDTEEKVAKQTTTKLKTMADV